VVWKTAWYGGASAVAFARMYRNRHWLSDTVLGAFLGYGVGRFVLNRSKSNVNLGISSQNHLLKFSVKLRFSRNQLYQDIPDFYSYISG
jgi:membrane-associated phospholipid phosphatase